MWEIIMDAGIDSLNLLPFLFLTYLAMELLEHHAGEKTKHVIEKADKVGPLWGGLLGIFPQCGFSAAASSLYAGRVITVGTLLAVFMSTSDEMLPIFISEAVPAGTIVKILLTKVLLAVITGFVLDLLFAKHIHCEKKEMDIHVVCEEEHCKCEDGVFTSAAKHTGKIFLFIFLISLAINAVMEMAGYQALHGLLTSNPVIGQILAGLVGLIPNCAGSVLITQLYLEGIITGGAMMSGLLVSAGVGILILCRLNRHKEENIKIIGILYIVSIVWGILIDILGITF